MNPLEFANRRVFVAGHGGMVGSALVRRLAAESCEIITATRQELDLTDQKAVARWMDNQKLDLVFLAAAKVGGIEANASLPAQFLYENLMIGANVIRAAHDQKVSKLVFLGSTCIYPKFAPQPIREDSLLTGPLEPTNEWYAIAKIAGLKLAQAYATQHGDDFICVQPTNLYGPGDNYNLKTSHVLPALLRKAHEAKGTGASEMVVWGSGVPLREFLHVDDLADAVVFLARSYTGIEPVNIGSGTEISIRQLAELVCRVVGYSGKLVFDQTKPDGTPRKQVDSSKLHGLGWNRARDLEVGVAETYAAAKAQSLF